MSWLYLGIAVIFEIAVAISAGNAKGFTKIAWTIVTLVSGAIGTYFLSLALLTFDVGVGYAIWYAVLPRLNRTRAAIVQLTVPAIAATGGVVFIGEALSLRLVLATVFIVGGVALALVAAGRRRRI